jgi:hypothetical protein
MFPDGSDGTPFHRLFASLPRLQPSLESLYIRMKMLLPETAGLSALTALTDLCLSVGDHNDHTPTRHVFSALPPPPFFSAMSSLKRLDVRSEGTLLVDSKWTLPHLTYLLMPYLSPDSSALPAALPALRSLVCHFTLAPDYLPPLPASLTRLHLGLDLSRANTDPARPRFTADRVLRWTDASPLSACPALSCLFVHISPHRPEGPGMYYVNIPKTLSETVDVFHVKAWTDEGATGIVRAPAALRERLTAPGALELKAHEVVWV